MLIYNKNGLLVNETTRERAKAVYGIPLDTEPIADIPEEEWNNINGPIRYIDGKLHYGFTQKELDMQHDSELLEEIAQYKSELSMTDYVSCKIAEGAATKEEYAEVLTERQQWRDKINELQGQLKNVGNNQ